MAEQILQPVPAAQAAAETAQQALLDRQAVQILGAGAVVAPVVNLAALAVPAFASS